MSRPPLADEARPARCPHCQHASRSGASLGLWSHGLRERQLRGPKTPETTPTLAVIRVRRYRCRRCEAVITVVPREVLARKHFSGGAIALAIALFGHCRLPAREVRARVSPWRIVGAAAHASWASLRRWIAAAVAGRLFPAIGQRSGSGTWRQRAAKLAVVLSAYAPVAMRSGPLEEQAFYVGGALMA